MTSLGLSKEDVQSRNKWRRRVKGSGLTEVHLEEMAVKIVCMRACVCVCMCGCVRINVLLCFGVTHLQSVLHFLCVFLIGVTTVMK